MKPLNIFLNGQTHDTPANNLSALLSSLKLSVGTVAIAVNDEVIPSADYALKFLAEGDRVEIIQAASGG